MKSMKNGLSCRLVWASMSAISLGVLADAGVASAQTSGKHFLWRVTNAAPPFYIPGSEHAMKGGDYPLGSEIDIAIKQCRRFVFEFNPKTANKEQFNKKLSDAAL